LYPILLSFGRAISPFHCGLPPIPPFAYPYGIADTDSQGSHRFRNFGRNVCFDARYYFEPRTEQEVLELLEEHKGEKIRAIGALHSWSEAPVGQDVVLSLRHLAHVRLAGDKTYAEVGAGCSVHSVLEQLRAHGVTLPAIGMTGEQSIAGAISTATHGSGRSSMSHYVSAVRLASYDRNGVPTIRELTGGPALKAARCALGRMGVLLSVRVECVPTYRVEEVSQKFGTIGDVLAERQSHPLMQFYLMPWSWVWIAQLRRSVDEPRSGAWARLKYRMVRGSSLALLNWATIVLARLLKSKVWVRRIYRLLTRLFIPVSIVDSAERVLMTQHRHDYVEAELFVPVSRVEDAAKLVEQVLRYVARDSLSLAEDVQALVAQRDDGLEEIEALRGSYVHHYPITFRHVQKDSTLISMSSDEEMFAISFITFSRDLPAFEATVGLLASTMARAFKSRPHWGKVLPLGATELNALIPGLRAFRAECDHTDPGGVFANDFTQRVLGF
jgi:FAD/FMN-containing dehydrogenase